MPKFASKRNRPDAKPRDQHPDLLRRTKQYKRGGLVKATGPTALVARSRCTGLSKGKLKVYWLERLAGMGIEGLPASDDPKYRYSEITELARHYKLDTTTQLLPPDVRDRCRCSQPAIAGGMVCKWHGGSLKKVMQAAKDRIMEMVDPALSRQLKIINKGKHEPAVVAAIKDVLDRAGLKKPDEKSIEEGYSDELIAKMAETFSEEELTEFIRLSRKLVSIRPDDEGIDESTDRPGPKTITVTAERMADMLKTDRKVKKTAVVVAR
jgi:hypothetical protein